MNIYNSIPDAPDEWLLCVYKHTFKNPGHDLHNKTYIGFHKDYREVLNGTYKTSGKICKPLMKKYGINHFETEILCLFNNTSSMKSYEKELTPIEKIYPQNLMSMNLVTGGVGWSSEDVIGEKNYSYNKPRPDAVRKKIKIGMSGKNNPRYGKPRSIEVKNKISNTKTGIYMGKNHPMYKHDITTHSIINLIIEHKKKMNKKLSCRKWREISNMNNSIQDFSGRITEINQILNSNCKTMTDVFKWIYNNRQSNL